MYKYPFKVEVFRYESGNFAQRITFEREAGPPHLLLVCTSDGESSAISMCNSLEAMLERAFEAGQQRALGFVRQPVE